MVDCGMTAGAGVQAGAGGTAGAGSMVGIDVATVKPAFPKHDQEAKKRQYCTET